MKRYALLTDQGTACYETVLNETEFAKPEMRALVESRIDPKSYDPPIPGTWTDVTENEALQ